MRPTGRPGASSAAAALWFVALFACCSASWAADLKDFTSDGCSLFPDGTMSERGKWCTCCLQHDIAYWRGGTEQERKNADEALRACVLDRTGDAALAEMMFHSVRTGGHPAFPTWYRWGYGLPYGRDYKQLNDEQRTAALAKQAEYKQGHPGGYCSEKHAPSGKNEGGEGI